MDRKRAHERFCRLSVLEVVAHSNISCAIGGSTMDGT